MAELLFVGTGDAFGSGGRRNSAILVRQGGRTLLLDCGATTLLGLKSLGIDPREIDAIAISHYHGDHASGVPFLLLDYTYEDIRERPIDILGPPGIREHMESLTESLGYNVETPRPHVVRYHEFECGTSREVAGFSITPEPAYHHPDTRPHMIKVETNGRSIVFSGDTGWTEALPDRVGDASLFICECVFMQESFEFHLSHERLVAERSRLSCDRMILTHLGSQVLADIDRVDFETAHDGLRLKL